jgi:hypothetical protein
MSMFRPSRQPSLLNVNVLSLLSSAINFAVATDTSLSYSLYSQYKPVFNLIFLDVYGWGQQSTLHCIDVYGTSVFLAFMRAMNFLVKLLMFFSRANVIKLFYPNVTS